MIVVDVLAGEQPIEGAVPTLTLDGEPQAPFNVANQWGLELSPGKHEIEATNGDVVTRLPLEVRRPSPAP